MNGVRRLEQKLNKCVEANNFYESHQLYVTLYSRYSSKGLSKDSRDLLRKGANYFSANEQNGSAAHLCLLYLDELEKNVTEVDDDIVETIKEMNGLIPMDMVEMDAFQKRAVTWSAGCTNSEKAGDPRIRHIFAVDYWKRKMYPESQEHFLYSNDGKLFGEMLQQYHCSHGSVYEIDLFLAQVILQLLCIQREQVANGVFVAYTRLHPGIRTNEPPFDLSLVNFIFFLLIAVEGKKLSVFTVLCEKYEPSLARDHSYAGYLEKIGQNYFGLKVPKKRQGMFETMMQNLFVDDDTAFSEDGDSEVSKSEVPETNMLEEDLD